MSESPLGRVIEIAEHGRHLSKEAGFIVLKSDGHELGRVPIDDIAAVIATSRTTTASCAAIAELAERGIPLVICGANFAPSAIVWPLSGHHAQQRHIEAQIDATRPLSKQLWTQIVKAKVRRQGAALAEVGAEDGAFDRLARTVRAGDPDNVEAQAARRYWRLMFGTDFRRDTQGGSTNAMLNYGYAILRSAAARAIVAAGLHPGIGIFHRHPNNPMPLADDLMEPFRPVVDLRVRMLVRDGACQVDVAEKRALAAVLGHEEESANGASPVSTCMIRLAQSVAASFVSGTPKLDLPRGRARRGDGALESTVDESI